jgi:hypothetical protein
VIPQELGSATLPAQDTFDGRSIRGGSALCRLRHWRSAETEAPQVGPFALDVERQSNESHGSPPVDSPHDQLDHGEVLAPAVPDPGQ